MTVVARRVRAVTARVRQAEEAQQAVEGLVGHLAEPGSDIRVACHS
ncbi:hypothetical protein [Streptomyces blattellae]|nr:hypothetical protein [Streptomyces blattellae]